MLALYRRLFIFLVRAVAILFIFVWAIIAICAIADIVFTIGWGRYPWAAVLGSTLGIALGVWLFKHIPSIVDFIDEMRG